MEINIKNQLEAAAAIIMAPPNQVKSEERHQAEAVFMQFRSSKGFDTIPLCQRILETSTVDLVVFECITIIKNMLINNWDLIPEESRMNLRQYLLNFVLQHTTAPFFIREKILQVVAIMIKRNSLIDQGVERGIILEQAKAMFSTQDPLQTLLASALVLAIVQEHADTVKSEDTGLTFDDHFRAKKKFEFTELRNVFSMIFESLTAMVQTEFDASKIGQLHKHLEIMEIILCWGYISPLIPKKLVSMCETVSKVNQHPPLRLATAWQPIIFDPKLLETFFYVYWKIREAPDLRQKGLICLVQLSTLRGPVFSVEKEKEQRVVYLKNYLSYFLQLLGNETCPEEIVGFTLIVRKLLLFHNSAIDLREDSVELFNNLIEKLFNLTIKCIEGGVLEDADDQIFMEAFENTLESWVLLLQSKDELPDNCLTQFIVQIFNKYVQCHLSPPEGTRPIDTENDEVSDEQENDRARYQEQLIIIGSFAREVLSHALPILAKLLEDKIRTFAVMLQTLYAGNISLSEKDSKALENIFEDLHWLLMITGYTLGGSEGDGETQLIPPEINQFCQARFTEGSTDIPKSLELLAKPDKDIAEIFPDPDRADLVLRIAASVLRLCELQLTALKCNMVQCLSPELSATLMWFLKMWLDIYLFPLPEYYEVICEPVKVALGIDTDCGKYILNYALTKVCFNICHFTGETKVIDYTVEVFLAILRRKHRCLPVLNSQIFGTLLSMKDVNIHVSAKRGLLKGLVQIAGSITEDEQRKLYIDRIFGPVYQKYVSIMHKPDIKAQYQSEEMKQAIITVLEEVRGCIQGSYQTITLLLFEHFKVMFMEFPDLLNLYRNYDVIVELVLQLLCEIIINVDYLDTEVNIAFKNSIYTCCISVIKVWIACNSSKISMAVKSYDDCPEDILLMFKLLSALLSKTLLDDDNGNATLDAGEVVVFGLTNLMPLITMDLIRFPEFCAQYYRTISMFAETKSHMVTQLEPELLKQILNSVQLGLNTFTTEIQSYCFDLIISVANAVYYEQIPNSVTYTLMLPFLEIVFNMIIARQIDGENKQESYSALFALACAYTEQFEFLIDKLVSGQTNPQLAERVQLEHNNFKTNLTLRNNRILKNKFIEKFDKFITAISFITPS